MKSKFKINDAIFCALQILSVIDALMDTNIKALRIVIVILHIVMYVINRNTKA